MVAIELFSDFIGRSACSKLVFHYNLSQIISDDLENSKNSGVVTSPVHLMAQYLIYS